MSDSESKDKKQNPLDNFKRNDSLYNKFSKMLKTAEDAAFYKEAKLVEIQTIDLFEEVEANLLASLYDDEDSDVVRFGSVMNSAYTQGNTVFQITVGSVNNLSVLDPHHDLKKCDGTYYRKMVAKAITKGWIKQLRPAVTGKKGARKGAIYEIVHPDFLDPLLRRKGMAQHLAEKDYILSWYEGGAKPVNLTEEQEAYAAEMQRRAAEKRKNRNET